MGLRIFDIHRSLKFHFMLAVLFFSCAACDPSSTPQASAPSFDYLKVSDLLLSRFDPLSGQGWMARLKKTGPEDNDWQILSAPHPILDPRANGDLILHLLDTLRGIKVIEKASNGPLESFGLSPALAAISWSLSNGEHFELRLGNPTAHGIYALLPGSDEVEVIEGSFPTLLRATDRFATIRQTRISTLSSDDANRIEISHKGKAIYAADREGTHFKSKNGKIIQQKLIEEIFGFGIDQFVDDESGALLIVKKLEAASEWSARIGNRDGQTMVIRCAELTSLPNGLPHGYYVTVSTRGRGAFRVHSGISPLFAEFLK